MTYQGIFDFSTPHKSRLYDAKMKILTYMILGNLQTWFLSTLQKSHNLGGKMLKLYTQKSM